MFTVQESSGGDKEPSTTGHTAHTFFQSLTLFSYSGNVSLVSKGNILMMSSLTRYLKKNIVAKKKKRENQNVIKGEAVQRVSK